MADSQNQVSDVFQRALAAKQAQQAEVESKKNYTPIEYEEFEYCALETNKEKVFRPVGNPLDVNTMLTDKPTDIKFTLHSQIAKDDNSGYFHVNWPFIVKTTRNGVKYLPDPNYILTRLYNKVYENEWVDYPEGETVIRNGKKCTGEYKFYHKDTEVFKLIELNGKNGQMNKFFPKPAVYMNVIDRTDDWCVKNKKTKVLLTSLKNGKSFQNAAGETITPKYASRGISISLYEKIFNSLIDTGGWNKDCVIKKTGEKLDTEYSVFAATDLRVQTKDISKEAFDLSKDEGLPSDWVLNDLEGITRPTSATKLLKNKVALFKMFDAQFNMKLTEELQELAKKEQEEWNNKKKSSAEKSLEEQKAKQTEEIKSEEVKAEVKPSRARTSASVESTPSKSIEDLCKENFPKFDILPDDEKKFVINSIVSFDGTRPIWKKEVEVSPCSADGCFYKGTTIQVEFPFEIKHCPVCGATYE